MDIHEETLKRVEALLAEADRHVLSLSTAVLALSVTFRSSLIGHAPTDLWMLAISWLCFLVAILSSISSLFAEAWMWLDIARTRNFDLTVRRRMIIAVPRFVTAAAFTAGMTMFATFALLNLYLL